MEKYLSSQGQCVNGVPQGSVRTAVVLYICVINISVSGFPTRMDIYLTCK